MILSRMVALSVGVAVAAAGAAASPTAPPEEIRAIASDAYLYAFPIVDSYKTLYAQALDAGGADYKAPLNHIGNTANVFTPADTAIITPNSDTPYSFVWMDLRAEPLVLTLPTVDARRYFSVQLIDLYTHNFAYLGRRATGSAGGAFLIAGPSWSGVIPTGISQVIRSETELAYALYRTQLFGPDDLAAVRALQAEYTVQPLSAFTGTAAPPAAPTIDWPKPQPDMLESPALFRYANFLLAFAPTHPSERALMERFAKIGVGPGLPFDEATLSPAVRTALAEGIADGQRRFAEFKRTEVDTHRVRSSDFFGSRAELNNNYLYRFAGARLGIYGNSGTEAVYVGGFVDADGQPLDASTRRYTMHFAADGLPPNDAFWSLTMYDGRSQLLVANQLQRYLINSTMEANLVRDADGGVTLYLQADPPPTDRQPNWLPAPAGPFYTILRIYQPRPEVQSGAWEAPPVRRAD